MDTVDFETSMWYNVYMNKCTLEECENLTSNPKFCSLSCGAKHQHRHSQKPLVMNIRTCERIGCENTFNAKNGEFKKIYCSRSCAATVNNQNRARKKKKGSTPRPVRYCNGCGGELGYRQKLYCSGNCYQEYRTNKRIEAWLSGEWDGSSSQGASATIKKYLIKEAGYRCASPTCAVPGGFSEINPVTGRCPLEVDHIDGDCYNNSRDNLAVVCPNCHALTPTYRALNKNGKRKYRNKT